jgi:hypothetical protein
MRPDKTRESMVNLRPFGSRPFNISETFPNNTYRLQNLEGGEVFAGPVNGHFLKRFFV